MNVYDPPHYAPAESIFRDIPRGTPVHYVRRSAIPGWGVYTIPSQNGRQIACPEYHVEYR